MYRVLLIDDDDVDRMAVSRSLDALPDNYHLENAVDGRSALSVLEQTDDVDCILLDYRLPDIDGLELLDQLSYVGRGPHIPVIMLTGDGSESVAVDAMKRGADDYMPKADLSPERLSRIIQDAIAGATAEREHLEAQSKLKRMAFRDSQTGLGNRNLFDAELTRYLAAARRNQSAFCLMLLDLNRFKDVNDELGHLAGDQILATTGRRLRRVLRDADSLYRIGGDEFAAIVDTGVTPQGLKILANRIGTAINEAMRIDEREITVGVAIGFGLFPQDGDTEYALFQCADKRMYEDRHIHVQPLQPVS